MRNVEAPQADEFLTSERDSIATKLESFVGNLESPLQHPAMRRLLADVQ